MNKSNWRITSHARGSGYAKEFSYFVESKLGKLGPFATYTQAMGCYNSLTMQLAA